MQSRVHWYEVCVGAGYWLSVVTLDHTTRTVVVNYRARRNNGDTYDPDRQDSLRPTCPHVRGWPVWNGRETLELDGVEYTLRGEHFVSDASALVAP